MDLRFPRVGLRHIVLNVRTLSICALVVANIGRSEDRVVANRTELSSALSVAQDGDRILLRPGMYQGGIFQSDLTGVEIRSLDPNNRAVIDGGRNGFRFSDAKRVTIRDLVFTNQTENGLNIDDGGSFETPSTDIVLRDLEIRDLSPGNHDGIKLTGVNGFLIDRVRINNWGDRGSAVDPVGSHNGVIQNSSFRSSVHKGDTRVVGAKGGSKNVTVRANRIQLDGNVGRGVQAGGTTGDASYRFIDGDSGYEAAGFRAEGNIIIGGSAAFSFVNTGDGIFHRNLAIGQDDWSIRILNENIGRPFIETQNGQILDNVFQFNDTADEFRRAVNVGPDVMADTFDFERNQWLNTADPSNSEPQLPSPEVDGIYGEPLRIDPDKAIQWDFEWGNWVVNATDSEQTVMLDANQPLFRAIPGMDADFDPLMSDPLDGTWTFEEVTSDSVTLSPFSQGYFVTQAVAIPEPASILLCAVVFGYLTTTRRRK